jgi:hypothetical protein
MTMSAPDKDEAKFSFKPTLPNLQQIAESTWKIPNLTTANNQPVKIPARSGKMPGRKSVSFLPEDVQQASFLFVFLTNPSDDGDDCKKVYCTFGSGVGTSKSSMSGTAEHGGYSTTPPPPTYPPNQPPPTYPPNQPPPTYPPNQPPPTYPQGPQTPQYPQGPQTPQYPQGPQTPQYPQGPQGPTTANRIDLTTPLILIGTSLISKLGDIRKLSFENYKDKEVSANIIVGYDVETSVSENDMGRSTHTHEQQHTSLA